MKKFYYTLIVFFSAVASSSFAQMAVMPNHAFQPQEKISYNVYYNVIGIYIHAGTATFTTLNEKLQDEDVFHVVGEGSTNPKYDWIFKVRDRYESYFKSADLQPVKFVRQINEGKYKKHEEVTFNQQTNTAITKNGVYKVPENVQDVISVMYYARNINYDQYKSGDKIPFSMFIDDKVYNMYIHYIGKETIKTKYGKFNAIKLKPLLLKGSIFDGGEKMTIWVTDDGNHIPVRAESPIVVGSVKIDLMHYENLKYPITALR
jgi:ribosomal protein L31E